MIGKVVSQYKILVRLGRGGMDIVYAPAFFKKSSHLPNHIPMRFPMRACAALLVTVWMLVSAPSGGYAQDPFFDAITRDVVMGVALTADTINGSNDASNMIPKGSIVVYSTKEGRYGKFKVLRYGYTLWLRIVTYAPDGSVHFLADSVSINGTYSCDLDSAKQCYSGPRSDFKWDMRTDTDRAIEARNGAKYAVYRIATAVDRPVGDGPQLMALHQNFPNPFNPSTTIRYGLPHGSAVQLTVYNTLGQQVAQLVNGEMDAGYHEVKFDGSKLANGVYLYRMQAGSYVETKKLLLVR